MALEPQESRILVIKAVYDFRSTHGRQDLPAMIIALANPDKER
jgi:hypothetical protein